MEIVVTDNADVIVLGTAEVGVNRTTAGLPEHRHTWLLGLQRKEGMTMIMTMLMKMKMLIMTMTMILRITMTMTRL